MRSFNSMKKKAKDECAKGGVEPRIKLLVNVFNSLPGICTTSSCAGHKIILNPTQTAADAFYIDFIVDIETGGLHSLDLITQMARITGGENIIIISWFTPSNRSVYTIEGEKNASPKKLARALELALLQIGRRNFIVPKSRISEECKTEAISCKESGNSLFKEGNYQEALVFYEKGLRLDPNNSDILHNKNMTLVKLGRIKGDKRKH